jgi:glycosyltransferase involved in cell wall biosynthesis
VIHNFSESPGYSETEKEPFYLAAGRIWDKGKNLKLLEHLANRLPWPMRTLSGLPHTDALAQMQHASIYVHPALYEPFGLGILEAARAQCCLVLSDIPSLRELWDGAAAFLDPRDLEAWVQTLSRLSSDLSERESLAQLACRHATRFSADTAVQQYRQLYDLLIRRQAINEASKDAAA